MRGCLPILASRYEELENTGRCRHPRQRGPVDSCGRTTKAPGSPGPLMLGRCGRLFQRAVDRRELGVQGAAEAVHDRDDGERDAGGDQSVFDGGGAGLILHETRNKVLHRWLHVYTWLRTSGGLAGVLSTVTMPATLGSENCNAVNSIV